MFNDDFIKLVQVYDFLRFTDSSFIADEVLKEALVKLKNIAEDYHYDEA